MIKNLLLVVGVLTLIAIIFFLARTEPSTSVSPSVDALTFSNTQTLGEGFYEAAHANDPFLSSALSVVSLPLPPTNSSTTTQEEIVFLHSLVKERSSQKIDEIYREMDVATTVLGTSTIGELVAKEKRPLTNALMYTTLEKAGYVIHALKLQYDRVRPSFIDPTLIPAIEIPAHPAYPSGHATQYELLAYFFSELDPEHSESYFTSSKRVAHNREIAGVHYPSDSQAGQLLASQLFSLLKEDPEFILLLEDARTEWK